MRGKVVALVVAAAVVCAQAPLASRALADPHDALIAKHASANGVPETLVRRVIRIESRGNPRAVHSGNYGLMQIRLGTARGVGYTGDADGLLDADTNLNYAVKYLAGAYRAAGCDADRAVAYYQRGYYGAAQRECGESAAAAMKVAQQKPADVIKPKVVRIEAIGVTAAAQPPARAASNFEPVRSAPPAQQVGVADPPLPSPRPSDLVSAAPVSTPKADRLKPAGPDSAATFQLASAPASVPLPLPRPEFKPAPAMQHAPKRMMQAAHQPEHTHVRVEKKDDSPVEKIANAVDPSKVVSALKKFVTPDSSKKPRRVTVEAEADPASHVQAPQ